jgi:hypothetical protein
MVAAAAGAGKTLLLRLAAAVGAVATRQAHRQLRRLPGTEDSQHRQGRVLTFKESPGRLALEVHTTHIWAVAAVVVLPMLPLLLLVAGRCLVAAAAAQAAEQAQFPR